MTDRYRLPLVIGETRIDQIPVRVDGGRDVMIVMVDASALAPRRLAHPVIIEQRPLVRPRRRGRLFGYLALALALPAAAIAWLAPAGLTSSKPGNSVDIALPSGIEIELADLPPPARPVALPTPPVAARPVMPKPAAEERRRPSKLLSINELAEVGIAIRLALKSGVAQPWAARGLQGFAIAGPAQMDGSHVCRNVAVWVKNSAEGQTLSTRKCMAEGGQWVAIGEPTLVADAPTG